VLSHRNAAALLALLPYSGNKIDVTVPVRGRRSRPGVRVHSTTVLHPADVTAVDGIPLTSVARTLIDLAAILHTDRLVKAIEASERLQLFDLNAIDAAIARGPTRKGVRRLHDVLTAYRPPPSTKSGDERRFLMKLHDAGLPEPHINTIVHGEEADLHFPHAHLIVELDGTPYHRSPRELARDRRKDAIWTRHGEAVLRFTDERLETDMTGAIADVIAVYEQRLTGASP
jgi:very-short-patch-repair endonuclease